MKIETKLKDGNLYVRQNMEELPYWLGEGSAYDLETRKGHVQILRIEVKDSASRYDPSLVMNDTDGHFIQLLEDDGTEDPENHFLPQRHYTIGYIFNRLIEIEEAKKLEKVLAERIKRKFEHIDTLNGYAKGVSQTGNFILEGKIEDYKYNQSYLNVNDFDEEARRKEEMEELVQQTKLSTQIASDELTEAQLLDMAEFAKKKKLKPEDKRTFNRIAYGLFNHKGEYSEEVAIKVLDSIGGDGKYDKYIKAPSKLSTVLSFYYWIQDKGYQMNFVDRYFEGMTDEEVDIVKEDPIKIAQYIDSKDMCNIITNGYRYTLVESPTGSGKTTAVVEAGRNWMDGDINKRIFVFLLPTVSLVEQTAKDKKMGEGLFGRKSVPGVIVGNHFKTGYLQVAATYDKADAIMNYINLHHKDAEVLLVMDEAHKEVSDYDFRRSAIRAVAKAKENEQTVKFIGLSGTPQEIDKALYDQMVTFEPENKETIFKNLLVLEYSETKEFIQSTTKTIIKGIEEGRKSLVFIQNKDLLEDTKVALDKMGVKSSVIKSGIEEKEGKEIYGHLIDEQEFADGVEVLLSTNFIADGINILNDTDKYDVIIAPDRIKSPIFNLSQIKQMSNRLRNKYENLIIPLFVSETIEKERLEHDKLFGFETRFKKLNYKNKRAAQDLKERFGDRIDEYHPGELERALSLPWMNIYADNPFTDNEIGETTADLMKEYRYYINKPHSKPTRRSMDVTARVEEMQEALFTADRRANRKRVSKEQEDYYARFPSAFINALEDIFEAEAQHMFLHDYIEGISEDKQALIDNHFPEFEELRKATEKEKREKFEEVFTPKVFEQLYEDFVDNKRKIRKDTQTYREFEKLVSVIDMKVIEEHLPFADHNTILKIAKNTNNRNEQAKFKRRFYAKRRLDGFKTATEKTDTHKVIDMLKAYIDDEQYYTEDAKGELLLTNESLKKKIIPKILRKVNSKDNDITERKIIKILNDYFIFESVQVTINKKSVRGRRDIKLLSEESIANEYNADVIDIRKAYKEFIFDLEQKNAA